MAAADGGVVVSLENAQDGAWGQYIEVEHVEGYRTGYAHLSRRLLEVGDSIAQGHVLALSGNTGRTTGPHLHCQLLQGGQRIDPTPYMLF